MAVFIYKGRDNNGQSSDGHIDAGNRDMAVSLLMQKGIIPISVEQHSMQVEGAQSIALRTGKIRDEELILLTRQLYSLIKAGIPIIRALSGLSDSNGNLKIKAVLQDINQSLISGTDLASAFKRHPKIFSEIYISMIHVGDTTGHLDKALLNLIDHLQMERDTTKRMKSATRYPIMVMSSIGVALVVITMFVIPSFSSVFAKLGAELPFATQILIATSNFMEHNWPLVLATTVGSYVGFKLYVSSSAGGILWDKYKLKIPLIGSILERIALSRFSRSFAMMLSSGVPIVNTLSIVAGTIGNRHIGRHVTLMADGIQRGERLTNTAAATGLFTPLVMQMLAVGEETGSIDKLLDQVADFYEREIDYELKKLAESIEPILLVFMGILVLILALGVFLPVWELSGAVSRN